MDFTSFEQGLLLKNLGFKQPDPNKDTWFGMLFESERPTFQYAFVGTGQWELFKQHCMDHGVFRPTPCDILRALNGRWALYIEEKNDIYTRWVCLNLDQPVFEAIEEVFEKFIGNSPIEAALKAWLYCQKNNKLKNENTSNGAI